MAVKSFIVKAPVVIDKDPMVWLNEAKQPPKSTGKFFQVKL